MATRVRPPPLREVERYLTSIRPFIGIWGSSTKARISEWRAQFASLDIPKFVLHECQGEVGENEIKEYINTFLFSLKNVRSGAPK